MKKLIGCGVLFVIGLLTGCVSDSKSINQMTLPSFTNMDGRLITDWQQKTLIDLLDDDIEIDRNQNYILLTVQNEKVFNDTDAITLKESFKRQLDQIISVVKVSKKSKIKVIVNSDDTLPAIESFDQTAEQALLIADYIKFKGVVEENVTFFGVGSHQPLADNSTKNGQKINRRLEIQISND